MSALLAVALLLLAVGLIVYLLVALIDPERF
ncbi:K(+)-transporting ATPase subunit F [Corynebacterium poyangense]|uniref:K(+)-transporting ATPase subunit F n=1 Tax=Corynebacterium poyangense TaxID=2684405 RepID=A0A7H0SQ57_9CORY|nr:K(+)-transporting ATPase subunit F [Corynebacterium poyangense]MBZ8178379.1 K(+)-transporting ATPase subunit F [Corynebacterium poyangense]QNQ90682.1 K(+)-transporting ATPase subunit F [Corynebacterium poyangense]